MLSFVTLDPGTGNVSGDPLVPGQAYLLAADDLPVPARVETTGGLVQCQKRSGESAALCIQWRLEDLDEQGQPAGEPIALVHLQTCLLPERDRPYLLALELARHRMMLVLNKLEDWALFELPPNDRVMRLIQAGRDALTEALVRASDTTDDPTTEAHGFTAVAERAARRALLSAVRAGDALAETQARTQFARRISGELAQAAAKVSVPPNALTSHEAIAGRAALIGSTGVILPSPPLLGCEISTESCSEHLQQALTRCADFISVPMRWVDMEPTEGRYLFGKTDRWIEWAVRTGKRPVTAGPLVDLSKGSVPEWLYIWEHDYETLRELVYEHIKTLVTRYRRTVQTWTVVSGLHVNSNITLSIEQIMDLTRLAVTVVRKLHPAGRVQIELDQPWGEYHAARAGRCIPPMMYADMIAQTGIRPDLHALRIEMGHPEPGRTSRDMMSVSALLDRYAELETPIAVSALSAPSTPPAEEELGEDGRFDPGYADGQWSPESQANWMARLVSLAVSKPFVHSVCWRRLFDPPGGGPNDRHDGLFSADAAPKPALETMARLHESIREKRAPMDQATPRARA